MGKGGFSHLPPFLPQGTVQGKLFVVNGSRMIARKRCGRIWPFPVQVEPDGGKPGPSAGSTGAFRRSAGRRIFPLPSISACPGLPGKIIIQAR